MKSFAHPNRRGVLCQVVAMCVPSGLQAASSFEDKAKPPFSEPDGLVFRQLQQLVRPALLDQQAGRLFDALSRYEQARAILTQSEDRNWPYWFYVNQPYGLALIQLGRVQQAVAPLKVAVDIERRMRASDSNSIRRLVHGLDAGWARELLRMESNRQAVTHMQTNGPTARTIKELLLDQSSGTMDAIGLLAHAYVLSGQTSEASSILDAQLDLARDVQGATPTLSLALEYRLFKMGASFSLAHDLNNARRALGAALKLNFHRMRKAAEDGLPLDAQQAAYAVRRLQLSATLGGGDLSLHDVEARSDLVARILETKGLGVRYAERLNRLLNTSNSELAIIARNQLVDIESQFAKLSTAQMRPETYFSLQQQQWDVLAPVMQELTTKGLAEVFQDGNDLLRIIRAALKNGVLIGYMAYSPLAAEKFAFGSPRYLRYCITMSDIQLTDIGPKHIVDKAVFAWRQGVLSQEPVGAPAATLSRLLLNDLPPAASQADHWTIEPDAALNLLPFEALPKPDGELLIKTVDIGYVTSTAQLIASPTSKQAGKARIIADPSFGTHEIGNGVRKDSWHTPASPLSSSRDFDATRLVPLPETRAEASAVEASLHQLGIETETFLGAQADVRAFDWTRSPQVLHVATHGMLMRPRGLPEQQDNDPLSQVESVSVAFPGRNAALAISGQGKAELFYASDIALLPLQDAELVVLSACDSGNGAIDVGEGIASLRRAVEAAGAASSITALWSVPSVRTANLMTGFYSYLGKGMTTRTALRQAKLDAIASNSTTLDWAGFVFAGRDANLSKRTRTV